MPDARNCRRCGKIFNYIGGVQICPVCKDNDEKDYKRVKDYLYEYPGATMSEVSSELNVSVDKIRAFLKDGRLEIVGNDSNLILECENCGKSIRTGRYCQDCTNLLSSELKNTAGKISSDIAKANAAKKGIGMRYLNKDTK